MAVGATYCWYLSLFAFVIASEQATNTPTRVDILMIKDMLDRGIFKDIPKEIASAVRDQLPKPTKQKAAANEKNTTPTQKKTAAKQKNTNQTKKKTIAPAKKKETSGTKEKPAIPVKKEALKKIKPTRKLKQTEQASPNHRT